MSRVQLALNVTDVDAAVAFYEKVFATPVTKQRPGPVIVPIFVIVMGSADGLHFVTHLPEEAHRISDPTELVASALKQVGYR